MQACSLKAESTDAIAPFPFKADGDDFDASFNTTIEVSIIKKWELVHFIVVNKLLFMNGIYIKHSMKLRNISAVSAVVDISAWHSQIVDYK